jgi:hypothetical protein
MLNVNVKCKCQMLFSLNSMDLRGKKTQKKPIGMWYILLIKMYFPTGCILQLYLYSNWEEWSWKKSTRRRSVYFICTKRQCL